MSSYDQAVAATVKRVKARHEKEAKEQGYKNAEAMFKAMCRNTKRAIIADICGGDKSLYLEAFGG